MSKSKFPSEDEIRLFRDAISGAQPMQQDKIPPERRLRNKKTAVKTSAEPEPTDLFYFSDEFEGYQSDSLTISYVQPGDDPYLPKNLKRGEYQPAVVLDLHGLTQLQAKTELAGLLAYCQREHLNCACIVHGKGSGILAKKVPNWLIQHPNVRAFHTAPTHWGRDGAVLVLLRTPL